MRLSRKFFTQPTLKVAKEMLGKFLIHKINEPIRSLRSENEDRLVEKIGGMIVETEAYVGTEDRASHAYGGKMTKRNRAEYLIGGHVYIYLVYGMYWQLNISTGKKGNPECVLIRALEPTDGVKLMNKFRRNDKSLYHSKDNLTDGPGKLCEALRLDRIFYGYDMCRKKSELYLEDRGAAIPKSQITAGPRIGIDYAGPYWAKMPWRFYLKNNRFVSKI